jgi:plasmid stabilization system protein ParE
MRKITFHEDADSEAHEAALYYEERATDLGLAFLDEIEKSSQRILANPMAYQRVGGEVWQAPVARFPYTILYVIEPDEHIRVIAVAHQKRRPGYWRGRLQMET